MSHLSTRIGIRRGLVDTSWLTTQLARYEDPAGMLPGVIADLNRQKFAVPMLGPELISDPNFANPGLWTAGTGWSISGGIATKVAGAGAYLYLTGFTVTPGKIYQIVTTVASRTAGAMQVTLGGVDGAGRSAAGTYTEYTTAATQTFLTAGGLGIYGNSTFAGTVTGISIREVLIGDVGANLAASGYTMSTSGTGAASSESPAGTLNLTPAAAGTAIGDFQITGLTVGATYLIGSTTETSAVTIAVGTTQGADNVMSARTNVGVSSIFMFTATATTQWLRFSRGNTTGTAKVSAIYVAQFSPRPTLRDATFDEVFTYTCSSTTARTYIDAAGIMRNDLAIDQPRWDWSTGKRRLLNEGQSTNLLLRSQEFDNASWSKTATTIAANSAPSPDGTNGADSIVPAASTAAHFVMQSATVVASTTHTFSVYVASGGATHVQIAYDNGASVGGFMNVRLSDGTVTRGPEAAGGGTAVSGKVEAAFGGYRLQITAQHTGTTGRCSVTTLTAATAASGLFATTTTTGAELLNVWGAQLEAQAFASSYIPTTSATVARQVESAKLSPLAQAIVNRAALTVAVRGRLTNTSTASRALFGNDGSGTLLFAANASQTVVSNWNGASGILGTLGSGAFNTSAFGAVLAFDSGGRVVAANGGAIASDTAAVGNRAVTYLGRSPGSATWGDGFYDNFVLYAARVSNAAVPALAVAA